MWALVFNFYVLLGMQKFALIWALFIASASLLPCCFFHDCAGEIAHHLQQNHQDTDDDHDHEGEDKGCLPCSPFHICQAQIKISAFEIPDYEFQLLAIQDLKMPGYYTPRLLPPSLEIWQPPKV